VISGLISKGESIRGQSGFVIALTFERQSLAQVVEALLLALGLPAAEATPERHIGTESTDE
jgi:hypothetical protein